MPNQACFLSLLSFFATSVAIAAPMSASGRIVPHEAVLSGLAIEHADVVIGAGGAPARAYLTLYNAGTADRRIMDVSIDGFGVPVVKRQDAGSGQNLSVADAFLIIPRRAELFMAEETLFLEFEETLDVEGERMMSVTFDDDSVLTVPIVLEPPGGVRTSHHHGIGDFE